MLSCGLRRDEFEKPFVRGDGLRCGGRVGDESADAGADRTCRLRILHHTRGNGDNRIEDALFGADSRQSDQLCRGLAHFDAAFLAMAVFIRVSVRLRVMVMFVFLMRPRKADAHRDQDSDDGFHSSEIPSSSLRRETRTLIR